MGKPTLKFWQIINMNFGFFGLQYSFGLQQANMSPIYSYLGAEESELPLLWLAGPMTGLIVQPIIGAISDKTITKWGRRTPYFLIGAIFCSLSLLVMPYSSTVWMAASVLWILDAANNVTQEPYRAFVSDKLPTEQHSLGFLTQSAFTGLGQTLSYLTPTLLIFFGVSELAKNESGIPVTTIIAFMIGAVVSIGSILWTLKTTKEIPISEEEKAHIRSQPKGLGSTIAEIATAFKEMPLTMKQMLPMMLFSWYAMFIYWQYIAKSLSKSLFGTTDVLDPGFRKADLLVGQIGAFYNFIAFFAAFGLAMLAQKYGPKWIHGACMFLAGAGLLVIPELNTPGMVFIPIVGMGLSWASMMGNPYVMLAGSIPPERTGVYMGIFNMFIVIPMLLETFTIPMYYSSWLGNSPVNAIRLAGTLLILAAISVAFIKLKRPDQSDLHTGK
ncbi:MAG: MFS transporter [Imperialibacter sp.]|uniref:MFS transporter n=1 Tax=Imperialibacter sp. TaxID=2038411 RepID=UPI0032EDF6F4